MASAKKRTGKTATASTKPLVDWSEAGDPSASSPLQVVLQSTEFQLSWDNNLSYHLANHLMRLRKFRGETQQSVAKAMGTSQGKIARIEGGDENVTIETVRRLAEALDARIRFALEPSEFHFPHLPNWWDCLKSGLVAESTWVFHGAAADNFDRPNYAAAVFSCVTPLQTVVPATAAIHQISHQENVF
jgi:DNA-binding XRE family transcriptional regulator